MIPWYLVWKISGYKLRRKKQKTTWCGHAPNKKRAGGIDRDALRTVFSPSLPRLPGSATLGRIPVLSVLP